jgi:hypothetical protein
VQKPYEGCSSRRCEPPVMHAGKNEARSIDTLGRRDVDGTPSNREARERSAGGNSAKAFVLMPWKGANPREQPAFQLAKPMLIARNSREGQNPEAAVRRSGSVFRTESKRRDERHVGSFQRRRAEYLLGGESSVGGNPMGAVGMRKGRHGPGGSKPSRG